VGLVEVNYCSQC